MLKSILEVFCPFFENIFNRLVSNAIVERPSKPISKIQTVACSCFCHKEYRLHRRISLRPAATPFRTPR